MAKKDAVQFSLEPVTTIKRARLTPEQREARAQELHDKRLARDNARIELVVTKFGKLSDAKLVAVGRRVREELALVLAEIERRNQNHKPLEV